MSTCISRRQFLRDLGANAAITPFILNLPSLGIGDTAARKKRLVIMFSPNGVVPETFWPDAEGGAFEFKESLKPLEPFKAKTLMLKGVCNQVKGDGDGHMRGMGCLLTGIELFPGNIQGGSDTPAGWSKGISIDQEITRFLQAKPETRTRFGSLEFGVQVSERADTWTRMSYAGPNQPMAPISNPYQMLQKLYGQREDQALLTSVLDQVQEDFKKLRVKVSGEDAQLLDQHASFVRDAEKQLKEFSVAKDSHAPPKLEAGVKNDNDNMPKLSRMQIDLLIDSFQSDYARIATLQYTQSVGGARMTWLGVKEGHHTLSHEPDAKKDVQEQLTHINNWYCGELAYLVKRLAETKEPGTSQSLLDNTVVMWTNELGKGNSHTRDNIPFVLVGNGLDFKMGRSLKYPNTPHNRLLLALANAFGHRLTTFGNPTFCADGLLPNLT
jgi:hypothetical protein